MSHTPKMGDPEYEHCPEPSFDELYELFDREIAYYRNRAKARFAFDPALEERFAKAYQTPTQEEFRQSLQEHTTRGTRQWLIDRLVLGPKYCDEHPEDPRIAFPVTEQVEQMLAFEEGWAEGVANSRLRLGPLDTGDGYSRRPIPPL